jgi:hypothetical protein
VIRCRALAFVATFVDGQGQSAVCCGMLLPNAACRMPCWCWCWMLDFSRLQKAQRQVPVGAGARLKSPVFVGVYVHAKCPCMHMQDADADAALSTAQHAASCSRLMAYDDAAVIILRLRHVAGVPGILALLRPMSDLGVFLSRLVCACPFDSPPLPSFGL